jgi:hypothetical protein
MQLTILFRKYLIKDRDLHDLSQNAFIRMSRSRMHSRRSRLGVGLIQLLIIHTNGL